MEKPFFVITRSFQPEAGRTISFDQTVYRNRLEKPILNLLHSDPHIRVIVVTNGDSNCKFSEHLIDDKTETGRALEQSFYTEIKEGKLKILVSQSWGLNPGSTTAINLGLEHVYEMGVDWVLIWSPELVIDDIRRIGALSFAQQNDLAVVGLLRRNWWQRVQWNVVQNTGAIWQLETLKLYAGFDAKCNGDGSRTYFDEQYGCLDIAGMEDFHLLLRMLKNDIDFRWGMFGLKNPVPWKTDFEPNSIREKNHGKKVARQYAVMQSYCKDVFPDNDFEETMERLFSCYFCR